MTEFKLDTGQTLEEDIPPTSNKYCGPCETRLVTTAPQYWCNSCEEGLCEECFEHHKSIKASRSHITVDFTKFMKLKPFISTIDTELNNIDKVIENRERNKEKISNQSKKSRSDIQILRKEINKHLDNLESQLTTQSDKIIEDANEKLENFLQRLKEKKRNVNVLRNNFSELNIGGSNLQVFISSKMIDNTLSELDETLNSAMTEDNMSELNLKFTLDPYLKDTITQLLEVRLQKNKPTVILDSSTKLTCQIVSEDVSKMTAVHKSSFDKSAFNETSNITCITSLLPDGKLVVADYGSSSILVFSTEGSIVKTVRFKKSSRLFGVTYVVKDRIAVSFPSSENIKILDTMEYKELKEIQLNKPCWGIHSVDDLIYVAPPFRKFLHPPLRLKVQL
ncbi:Hypothetical predicted protein [Mytilus galloprovincialis]|uniref:B box-type domain-containing protein n=1 Tax=Mytilus galloprovincialis TaxID=29158 RepID=A0A8B6HRV1_MYTGA|nr:Hypothetical predicted protein [Mytilus galloprovincialis]